MGDWKAILDLKTDKAGRGVSGLERCKSSLVDFVARFDLVDRFSLDYPVHILSELVLTWTVLVGRASISFFVPRSTGWS